MTLDETLAAELAVLRASEHFRATRPFSGRDRLHPSDRDGRPLLSFATNDYLGLAADPRLMEAATASLARMGVGAGASRLVTGESPEHRSLERALADYFGLEDALLFPTGYQANLGVITSLAGPDDLIVSDSANHASLIDGCRLSRARIAVYPHLDVAAADAALANTLPFRRRLLVTESLFSMDGDRAPLHALAAIATTRSAVFVVDEAHALGVTGPSGRGLAAATGVAPQVLIGTLGKALGAHGGFAAGSAILRDLLVNRARSFIYTTAGPPSTAAAAAAALQITRSSAGDELRTRASTLAAHARLALLRAGTEVPGQDLILPLVVGEERRALDLSAHLLRNGILVPAIRPPTVPAGTSRLRVTISAAHTVEDVDRLIAALRSAPGTANK